MVSNEDSEFIISPDVGLEYAYAFPNSKLSLLFGINTSFSRKVFLEGSYELAGDQEVLTGTFNKQMMLLTFGI